ncbi:4-hydroxythreonine-4-phosphate dehydrogenase PdxA [Chloroflexota bacterium]
MMIAQRPVIAITMGDAAGIGPEIIARVLAQERIYRICRPFVIGDASVMRGALRLVNMLLPLRPVPAVNDFRGEFGAVDILDLHCLEPADVVPGRVCRACGKAAMAYIEKAARLAWQGEVGALVTAPISKEATREAGCGEMGHLEFFARLTGVQEYATMLVSGDLRVVHLTTHCSLKQACEMVTRDRILGKLRLIQRTFSSWGMPKVRIAVAALNPHAGEGGLLGDEEEKEIVPAIEEARDLSIDARGPFPADSVFHRAINGEFDVVLALYHDQGHIPVKVHGFEKSVSIAMGLPFIRTSVDHGTAFDIAGRGIASSKSLEEAIKVAVRLAKEQGRSRKD